MVVLHKTNRMGYIGGNRFRRHDLSRRPVVQLALADFTRRPANEHEVSTIIRESEVVKALDIGGNFAFGFEAL